jgi:hypothetical protein
MEKLANHIALQSIAEGGMEKQALNAAQLLRMGRNFALRGKMDRFNKLMDMRALAADSSMVRKNRINAAKDANAKYEQIKDYLLPGDANPALAKRRFAKNRIVNDPIFIGRDMDPEDILATEQRIKSYLGELQDVSPSTRNMTLGGVTPTYNSEQLGIFNRALKQLSPELYAKVMRTGSF